jgi:hypothetical protein
MSILDILLVVVAVILLPLAFVCLVLTIAFVVGVIKALLPSTKRKEKEEFEKRAREALVSFEEFKSKNCRK